MQSRRPGEAANGALARAVASISAVSRVLLLLRLITQLNMNTGWLNYELGQDKERGWPKKGSRQHQDVCFFCTSAQEGTGSSHGRQKSGAAGSPRTAGSPQEESRLWKDVSTSTWKPVRSNVAGSARHRKPACTDSDNSIL